MQACSLVALPDIKGGEEINPLQTSEKVQTEATSQFIR